MPISPAALVLCLLAPALSAQESPLTADGVLVRVRANIAEYRTSLPNLSSDEQVRSLRLDNGKVRDETKIQSSFRVLRDPVKGDLHESRNARSATLNGKPVTARKVSPPYTFNGGVASVVGFLQSECLQYRLGEPDPAEAGKIVLLLAQKPLSSDRSPCTTKITQGRAVIDPVSFQVLRLEHTQEDIDVDFGWIAHLPFVVVPSRHNISTFTVDYAPVNLGEKTFWLPKLVTSTLSDKAKPLSLHYEAAYSNYHRFVATVTIGEPAGRPSSSP